MFKSRQGLKNYLVHSGLLRSAALKEAFAEVDRKDFVPKKYSLRAYGDFPVPIGFGQTISQPSTVAFMLNLLDIELGQKILDLGSGSGWTTALIAKSVGSSGRVFAVEKNKKLLNFGLRNIAGYGLKNIFMRASGKKLGLPSEAPFDRILVSAASLRLPENLVRQLKIGGIMVIPVKHSICKVIRKFNTLIFEREFPGFNFVPLT